MSIARRNFLKGGLAVTGGAALAAPAVAQGATVKWRMAASWPKSLDALFGSAVALSKRVGELTEGKFDIQVFAGGEIVPPLAVLDATGNGTIDCCHTLSSYFIGKNPAYAFDGGLPFGLNTRQQVAWLQFGGGLEMLQEVARKDNVLLVPVGNVGVQMGGWFRKEINTVDDLKGLKFRIGGFGGRVMQKLGVVPQQIAAGDIYSALERGTIDAAEWIGPYDDAKFGFVKVARYYYTPGWWEGSAQITSFVNLNAWNALPAHFKAAFQAAANEQQSLMMANYDQKNPAAVRSLIAAGAQLKAFPAAVMDASHKAAVETINATADTSPDFKKLLDAWRPNADASNSWFRISEQVLDSYRFAAPPWAR
jgi:TRAP-type mannitol/chloroaromatic compound transport system substrate-binding protein